MDVWVSQNVWSLIKEIYFNCYFLILCFLFSEYFLNCVFSVYLEFGNIVHVQFTDYNEQAHNE